MIRLHKSNDTDTGYVLETIPGEIEQAITASLAVRSVSCDFPDQVEKSMDLGDWGGTKDAKTVLLGAAITFEMHHRYGPIPLVEAHLRDALATAVSVTGTADIELVLAGTHEDGETGIQIKGASGAFQTMIDYYGTAKPAQGVTLYMTGWDDDENNQPVLIHTVWNDGNDLIDVKDGWGAAEIGEKFGAPKAAAAAQSPKLSIGAAARQRQSGGALMTAHYTFLLDFFTMTEGRFQAMYGGAANNLIVKIDGKGVVTLTVDFIGVGWAGHSDDPPTGQAIDSHMTLTPLDNEMLCGADQLEFVAITTRKSANNPTPRSLLLSDANVKGLTLNHNGGGEAETGLLGTTRQVPVKGPFEGDISIDWQMGNTKLVRQLSELAPEGTRQQGALQLGWVDADGQRSAITLPRIEFGQTGANPGSAGQTSSGTISGIMLGMRGSAKGGEIVIQQVLTI